MPFPSRFLPFVLLIVLPLPLQACNVPVFRYALERSTWNPDIYEVLLFHKGPLPESLLPLVQSLREAGADGKGTANFTIEAVDVSKPFDDKHLETVWKAIKEPVEPWLVVLYPHDPRLLPVWAGPPTAEIVRKLTTSPARGEIAKRILKGDSVVWVFLDGPDKETNDTAFKLLTDELKGHEKNLKLPEGIGLPGSDLLSDLPLKIAFSTLRLSRADADEAFFIELLTGSEKDLKDYQQPMVFAVFGRGRSLEALVGKGINAENIEYSAKLLCGPCGCEVKRLNPGFDLLMTADWASVTSGRQAEPPPELPRSAVPQPEIRVVEATIAASLETAPEGQPFSRVLLLVGGGGLLIVFVGTVVLLGTGRRGRS